MKASKKNKSRLNVVNKEALYVSIVAFSILSIISLYSESTGFVGSLIKEILLSTFGIYGYILPYISTIMTIIFMFNIMDLSKKIIYIFLANISTVIIIHTSFLEKGKLTFIEAMKVSMEFGKQGIGGGLVGCVFSYISVTLFGKIGSYIILSSIVLISILTLTDKSLINIIRKIYSSIKNFIIGAKSIGKELMGTDIPNKMPKIVTHNNDETDSKGLKDYLMKSKDEKVVSSLEVFGDQEEKNENDKRIKILDYSKQESIEDLTENKDILKKNYTEDKKDSSACDSLNKVNIINNTNFYEDYKFPSIDILRKKEGIGNQSEEKEVIKNANKLLETLSNFGIEAKISQVSIGPSITRYEIQPAPGVKVSRIVSLSNDIALSLASSDLRMEAPIPGKSAIGIEVPNKNKVGVNLREIIESKEYEEMDTKIPIALGKDISGKPMVANIEKMPHLLIAGATGSGKSVCINTLIASILYKSKPNEVKLLMIDPKVVELSIYNGIPHLLIPVVTDPKKAANALNWAVQEMTKRYKLFAETGVRDLGSYNNKLEDQLERMPQIVIIIDELADLMMVAASEVEDYICRLAQMARAAGIHLIIATQRPSVDIITGTIKANVPSRISFAVSSQVDSRTILDMSGAEKLLGRGDMLFNPVGESKPIRIQGAFIGDEEVEEIVNFLKEEHEVEYEEDVIEKIESQENISLEGSDELLSKAIEIVIDEGQASISLLQRKLKIGYARAARIVDEMEQRGVVGGHEGSKPRKVLITKEELES
ncbi:DNA translocase FtsK/SpoIIIE familiy [Gottschalkia acidurici 9a]|uniref:DNA translocase FtsK/SpoIIIE familiy n=1 Tax=Gottschalkia acidurici (strain ATCC 7906 / DSM 604 / BCRC 14475 / CIP 104303 / KCTC 5404 / NCIMB 10678 / 9a) TaxID=1128398 RepID=K0AZ59_GOTA9|nr:DNA translocase FtsK [Gottschalkia acidurici]AFS78554.1 DNA translocase FtsK/SpoIIIE familiy [Gottschalkia acidurici 9a]